MSDLAEEEVLDTEIPEVVETQNTQTEEKVEDDRDRNWRAFLEKRKEDQRLLEEERKKNLQLQESERKRAEELENMKAAFAALVDKKEPEMEEEDDSVRKAIRDELKSFMAKRDEENRKAEEERMLQQQKAQIQKEMPDLWEVCTPDNLAYLEFYHPETAEPIAALPDGFKKTVAAYKAIKKYVKMPTKEKEKIEKNLSKPKSIHSSVSNESQKEESSYNLSDKRKQETWSKMQRLISGEDEE